MQTKYQYHHADAKVLVGYPEVKVVICGRKGCLRPSDLIWLNTYEAADYAKGQRVFSTRVTDKSGGYAPTGAKVEVQ